MGKKPKPDGPAKPAINDGQTFTSGHIEGPAGNAAVGFVRLMWGLTAVWTPKPAPAGLLVGYGEGNRGTPNHRGGIRLWAWAWALLNGLTAEIEKRERYLIEWFELQYRPAREGGQGQMYAETMNTSHYQIWLWIIAAAIAIARHYGRERVYTLACRFLLRELALYDLTLHRGGHVFTPGARMAGATSELRTTVAAWCNHRPAPGRLVDPSRPITGRPNDEDGAFWSNVYNWGLWCLREEERRGGDLMGARAGAREPIELKDRMLLYYLDNGDWAAMLPHATKGSKHFMFWTCEIDGRLEDSPLLGNVADLDCPFPLPERFKGAPYLVVPGVNR